MSYPRLIAILLVVAALAVAALFIVQNSARTVMLSLDLGLAAFQLKDPVPVVALVGGSFGVGLLLGGGFFLGRAASANRKVRQLEQQIALADLGEGSEYR